MIKGRATLSSTIFTQIHAMKHSITNAVDLYDLMHQPQTDLGYPVDTKKPTRPKTKVAFQSFSRHAHPKNVQPVVYLDDLQVIPWEWIEP